MRPSPLRHPIAALRKLLGLGQTEFGKLVEKSARTIQSIELGAHELTEDLAQTISLETGVAYAWLMGGKPKIQPWVEGPGEVPYLREHFERTQHWRSQRVTPSYSKIVGEETARKILGDGYQRRSARLAEKSAVWSGLVRNIGTIVAAIRAAESAGRSDIAQYRVAAFADSMSTEFGQAVDDEFLNRYVALLKSCRTSVLATKSVLKKTGPTLRSPSIPQKRWVGSEGDTLALLWMLKETGSRLSGENSFEFIEPGLDEATKKARATASRKKRSKSPRV